MNGTDAFITIAGLTAITVVTRAFFLFSDRELVLPGWVNRGLRYAPLAALVALAAFTAYYFWRRGILGTIVNGVLMLVPLKLGLGW